MNKAKKWFEKKYGCEHMANIIELKDTESMFAIMEEYGQQQVKDNIALLDVSGHVPVEISTFLHRLRFAEHPGIRKQSIELFNRYCR